LIRVFSFLWMLTNWLSCVSNLSMTGEKIFEIIVRSHARSLYSFLAQIFLQIVVLEREYRNLGFRKIMKIMSPTSFETVTRTHARVPQSIPRWMFHHFEEVGLSKTLENIVELGRPTCSEIATRPLASWLLYSFLTRIFLQMVILEKEHRRQGREMNIVQIVKIVDKVVENLTRERWIPIDYVKSWNYFENYGHKTGGMGCIDLDKSNPVYLVGSYCKNRVRIIRIKWGRWCEIWIHIRIEKIVIVEFYFTNNHKQKRKSKQQKKRKEKIKTKPILRLI